MAFEYRPIHQEDLLLPVAEWTALITEIRPKLYAEDLRWLNEWEHYDKTHPMHDQARAEARRQSYSNWYKKLRESMIHD